MRNRSLKCLDDDCSELPVNGYENDSALSFADVLQKPYSMRELVGCLRQIIENRELEAPLVDEFPKPNRPYSKRRKYEQDSILCEV